MVILCTAGLAVAFEDKTSVKNAVLQFLFRSPFVMQFRPKWNYEAVGREFASRVHP